MAAVQIQETRYTHEAIIDEILVNPSDSQGELAKRFKYTETWISIIMNSAAFKERLAERKAQLVDPKLIASIEDRLDGVARRALDKIIDRLDNSAASIKNNELAAFAKLAIGDRNIRGTSVPQQNLYVVNIPSPAVSATEWVKSAQGNPMTSAPLIIDNEVK